MRPRFWSGKRVSGAISNLADFETDPAFVVRRLAVENASKRSMDGFAAV